MNVIEEIYNFSRITIFYNLNQLLDLDLPNETIEKRLKEFKHPPRKLTGFLASYVKMFNDD